MTEPNSKFQDGSSPNPNEPEDLALVLFLRTNAPAVPAPAPGLEDQLMQTILQGSSASSLVQPPARASYRWSWRMAALMGLALAGIGVGLGQLQRWVGPSSFSTTELAQLESFMVSGWDETVEPSESATDWDWLNAQAKSIVSVAGSGNRANASRAAYSQP